MSNTIVPFYKFRAEAGDEPTGAELLIFAPIGDWEDFGEVSAQAFANDLKGLPKSVKRLDIHINSPGGSVSEANAIYSRLADHPSNKNVYIDGLAASAATIVAMVGHKIFIRSHATLMIHMPTGITIGTAEDMRTTAAALEVHSEAMLNLYTKRTGKERDDLRAMMQKETWMTAQDAVENGFADEVRGVVKAAAMVGDKKAIFNGITHDLSRFHNVPAFNASTTERETTMADQTTTEQPPAKPKPGTTEQPPPAPPNPPPPGTPAPPAPAKPTSFDDGIKAERARIAALQKYDKPATHVLIVAAIADGRTVAEITEELFAALENAGNQNARHSDASVMNDIGGGDTTPNGDEKKEKEQKELGQRLTKAVQAVIARRGRTPRLVNGNN